MKNMKSICLLVEMYAILISLQVQDFSPKKWLLVLQLKKNMTNTKEETDLLASKI
jgi:hypothetical protein